MRKIWDIHGGVHPPENKTQTNEKPIKNIGLPDELIVPLNQHIGAPAVLNINVGDKVLKGQLIAHAQGYVSAAVHAPSSGEITAIEARPLNHPSGMEGLCAVIKLDGEDRWGVREPIKNWAEQDKTRLLEAIRNAGIAGMGGAGFPTAVKMNPRADQHIDTLILNGTECEPYITADDVLMRHYADDIISGLEIISFILGSPQTTLIGIEDNKPEAIASMKSAAEKSSLNIEVVSFPTKYPSGGEKQLIQILTGKEVPAGKIPGDIGIVLQNVGTARAISRAVNLGEPLIDRITTVVGESVSQQQNAHTLIGTPVSHVLQEHGFDKNTCARLIIGGPMMGYTLENSEAPVVKTTNCVLVPSHDEMPAQAPEQACIRCGMCAEACPASLLPQQLYWFSRSEDFDRLRTHNLFDCIECGACSFVCPSNIPLVQYYRASKGAIRHHDEEKRKADHSKKRFEFRKERIEKAEAEKAAKREARKKAAEAAKAKLAEAKSSDQSTTVNKAPASKATAENTASTPADPHKTKAKLERALSSAQSRVERAIKALSDAKEENLDDARIETLAARVKGAEQKAADAKKRLEAFEKEQASHASTENAPSTKIHEKLAVSPEEKLSKTIDTLRKRIVTAQEKVAEAEQSGSPTLDALKNGVAKLEDKLRSAEAELAEVKSSPGQTTAPAPEEKSAADAAIEKAKARSAAMATMSDEEKAAAQIASLQKRLEKAQQRLAKAEADNDDNVEAFRNGVMKLEEKLAQASKSE